MDDAARFTLDCPHCSAKLKAKAAPPAGARIKCVKCGESFTVGEAAKADGLGGVDLGIDLAGRPAVAQPPSSVFQPAELPWTPPRGEFVEAKTLDALAKRVDGLERTGRRLKMMIALAMLIAACSIAVAAVAIMKRPSADFSGEVVRAKAVVAPEIFTNIANVLGGDGKAIVTMQGLGDQRNVGVVTVRAGERDFYTAVFPFGTTSYGPDKSPRIVTMAGDPLDPGGEKDRPTLILGGRKGGGNVEITASPSIIFREDGDRETIRFGTRNLKAFLDAWNPNRDAYEKIISPY